jgi:A/G-specific adenine glycosylase
LDGNVKRVLARYTGFQDDLAISRNERALWALAQSMLPQRDWTRTMPRYTQGVMDLGATVCTPKQPRCTECPVSSQCVAAAEGAPHRYPVKTRKLKRTAESWWLLLAQTSKGDVLLEQRSHTGIWAGLYALPMFASLAQLEQHVPKPLRAGLYEEGAFKHVLTHKDLHLHVVRLLLPAARRLGEGQWVAADAWPGLGLPAPVRKLLTTP